MPRTPNRGPHGGTSVDGRIQIHPASATDPVSALVGDSYYNTALEARMSFDGTRSKWLSDSVYIVASGRNGNVTPGNFFRAINGMVLNATNRGIPVLQGTIVGMALSKTSGAVSTVEVLVNGAVVHSFVTGAAGNTTDVSIDVDILQGNMSFRNIVGGSTMSNTQISLYYKLRV